MRRQTRLTTFRCAPNITVRAIARIHWNNMKIRTRMQLLIAVINQEEKLDQVLAGFIELGITGATVVRSEGMGRMLSQDIPIFAGLQSMLSQARPQNQMVFSVIRDDDVVDGAIELLQRICGDLNDPATGIVFTLPVNNVVGLAPQLPRES
ncbi:hypothetical protein BH23GEM10_BH23GEM10_14620 [soil metagenome]